MREFKKQKSIIKRIGTFMLALVLLVYSMFGNTTILTYAEDTQTVEEQTPAGDEQQQVDDEQTQTADEQSDDSPTPSEQYKITIVTTGADEEIAGTVQLGEETAIAVQGTEVVANEYAVNSGTRPVLTFTQMDGYALSSIKVDGNACAFEMVENTFSYTLTDSVDGEAVGVTQNHTIEVSYTKNQVIDEPEEESQKFSLKVIEKVNENGIETEHAIEGATVTYSIYKVDTANNNEPVQIGDGVETVGTGADGIAVLEKVYELGTGDTPIPITQILLSYKIEKNGYITQCMELQSITSYSEEKKVALEEGYNIAVKVNGVSGVTEQVGTVQYQTKDTIAVTNQSSTEYIYSAAPGEQPVLNFTQVEGYGVSSIKMDGKDCEFQMIENKYAHILTDVVDGQTVGVNQNHTIEVSFSKKISLKVIEKVKENGEEIEKPIEGATVNYSVYNVSAGSPQQIGGETQSTTNVEGIAVLEDVYKLGTGVSSIAASDIRLSYKIEKDGYEIVTKENQTITDYSEEKVETLEVATYDITIKVNGVAGTTEPIGTVQYQDESAITVTNQQASQYTYTATHGDKITLRFTQAEGYHVHSLKIDNQECLANVQNNVGENIGVYTLLDAESLGVMKNHEIEVFYEKNETVQVSEGSVLEGDEYTIAFDKAIIEKEKN